MRPMPHFSRIYSLSMFTLPAMSARLEKLLKFFLRIQILTLRKDMHPFTFSQLLYTEIHSRLINSSATNSRYALASAEEIRVKPIVETNVMCCHAPTDSLTATYITQLKASENRGIVKATPVTSNCQQRLSFRS